MRGYEFNRSFVAQALRHLAGDIENGTCSIESVSSEYEREPNVVRLLRIEIVAGSRPLDELLKALTRQK